MRKPTRAFATIVIGAALLVAAGCKPLPNRAAIDPEAADCARGITQLQEEWRGTDKLTTIIVCAKVSPGTPFGGFYGGYVGNDRAVVTYGYGDRLPQQYRDVGAHEAGHAWEFKRLSPAQRQRFAQIRGLGWSSEDYADVFAFLAGGVTVTAYGGSLPDPAQVAAFCAERLVPC